MPQQWSHQSDMATMKSRHHLIFFLAHGSQSRILKIVELKKSLAHTQLMQESYNSLCLCLVQRGEITTTSGIPPFRTYLQQEQPDEAILLLPPDITDEEQGRLASLAKTLSHTNCALHVLRFDWTSCSSFELAHELHQILSGLGLTTVPSLFWVKGSPELEVCAFLMKHAVFPTLELVRATVTQTGMLDFARNYQRQIPFSITADYRAPSQTDNQDSFEYLVQQSESMRLAIQEARLFSRDLYPVLILGETGVGKDKFAFAIHQHSGLSGEYHSVNCSAYTSEPDARRLLFGSGNEQGLLERSHEGTLFLDRIASLPVPIQASLLPVLEGRPWTRPGTTRSTKATIRFLAGEIDDLRTLAQQGKIHPDLLGRLGHEYITVPPLRKRQEDIEILAKQWLVRIDDEMKQRAVDTWNQKELHSEALLWLKDQTWEGNVRELRRVLRSCCRRFPSVSILTKEHLVQTKRWSSTLVSPSPREIRVAFGSNIDKMESDFQNQVIHHALRALGPQGGNDKDAAVSIGMSAPTFSNWKKAYLRNLNGE